VVILSFFHSFNFYVLNIVFVDFISKFIWFGLRNITYPGTSNSLWKNSNLLLPNLQGGIALDVILLSPPQASQASHFLEKKPVTELLTPQKP